MKRAAWFTAFASMAMACAASQQPYSSFSDIDYGYENAATIWSKRAGLEVHVATLGSNTDLTPIVLLHPWGLNMTVWADVAPRLAEDRLVVLVDLPGHGKSSKVATSYDMPRLALAVLDAARHVGAERFIAIGNSLGGATAIAVAEHQPNAVDGMVLIAAPGSRRILAPLRVAARQWATPRALASLSDEAWYIGLSIAERTDSDLARRLRRDVSRLRGAGEWTAWSVATSRILGVVAGYEPALESIQVPALVVHGEADLVIWRGASDAMVSRLPNAELVVMEGCGHMPQIDCPERLATAIEAFVRARSEFATTPHRPGRCGPRERTSYCR